MSDAPVTNDSIDHRQPQLVDRTLNFLDLLMDSSGKDVLTRADLDAARTNATGEEIEMLDFASAFENDFSNFNTTDNGGIFGIMAGNADGISRADVEGLQADLQERRAHALTDKELAKLLSLGGDVSKADLENQRKIASAEDQPTWDSLIEDYEDTRNLISSDSVAMVTTIGPNGAMLSKQTPVNDSSITEQDIARAQETNRVLSYYDDGR